MRRWGVWIALGVLCLSGSMRWIVDEAVPERMPLLEAGVAGLVLGLVALGWAMIRRAARPKLTGLAITGAWGIGLFAVTPILGALLPGRLSGSMGLIAGATIPIAVLVVQPLISTGGRQAGVALALPLAGLSGVLLLLPARVPSGLACVAFASVIVASATAIEVLHERLRTMAGSYGVASVGLCSGAALLFASLILEHPRLALFLVPGEGIEAGFDMLAMVLATVLIRMLQPAQLSSRYLVVPLLVVVQALVMERPGIDTRTVIGLSLLLAGIVWLVRQGARSSEVSASILTLQ